MTLIEEMRALSAASQGEISERAVAKHAPKILEAIRGAACLGYYTCRYTPLDSLAMGRIEYDAITQWVKENGFSFTENGMITWENK
jgi:hypothetical protein